MNWRQLLKDALARLWRSIRKRLGVDKPQDDNGSESGFDGVTWLHADVSGWKQTATLNAFISGGSIMLRYDKANTWPILRQRAKDGGPLVGNVWAIIPHEGKRYAVAWDWMRLGQQDKGIASFRGSDDHMPRPLHDFRPRSGDTYGFFVSTAARGAERSGDERSNISEVTWP